MWPRILAHTPLGDVWSISSAAWRILGIFVGVSGSPWQTPTTAGCFRIFLGAFCWYPRKQNCSSNKCHQCAPLPDHILIWLWTSFLDIYGLPLNLTTSLFKAKAYFSDEIAKLLSKERGLVVFLTLASVIGLSCPQWFFWGPLGALLWSKDCQTFSMKHPRGNILDFAGHAFSCPNCSDFAIVMRSSHLLFFSV